MKFPLYFSNKIAFSKDNKNNLSRVIIFIGRLSVALGIIVSIITVSVGFGSKEAIKLHMADFSGHINIKSKKSNSSYDSSVLEEKSLNVNKIIAIPEIDKLQKFASVTGIMRNEKQFAGIIFKGVDTDFDHQRFHKFILEGKTPTIQNKKPNLEIAISQKLAKDLSLKINDSIVTVFSRSSEKLIYRKFKVVGIYKTDIKMIDEQFVIGGINHSRRVLNMKDTEFGGIDIFLKNINHVYKITPEIEKHIGIKNYLETATEKYPQIEDWIHIFDNNILVIIIIMLFVVVINIIMVLLILIIERTNSIGLLKTLGANNQQIRTIFINYTLLIMVPGLIIGNIIGLGILLLQKFFGIIQLDPDNYYVSVVPVDLNPLIPIIISLGMLIISGIALIFPSYLISRISPVKSLKYN